MNTDLEQCEQLARQLPLQERSVLLSRLISSLDELNESECESLWLKEAGRRYREYKEGNIPSRSGEEVFRDARATLREIR